MVIDTSAIVAILQTEPERERFVEAIGSVAYKNMSTVSFAEASQVLVSRYGASALRELDVFIDKAEIRMRSVDYNQAVIARRAFLEFGKGRHPAQLNFGDCFTYALARSLDQRLLFKGEDFSKTDIRVFVV
ncbi:MAG: type II toxin-antitoxin system VapC family toxin [Acidiferrobacterales bacterium]|nr:type II toxin-antitoxin system VapC family toxin [Acidiferrobacterales bacterium]